MMDSSGALSIASSCTGDSWALAPAPWRRVSARSVCGTRTVPSGVTNGLAGTVELATKGGDRQSKRDAGEAIAHDILLLNLNAKFLFNCPTRLGSELESERDSPGFRNLRKVCPGVYNGSPEKN